MTPFPENEILTINRLKVALRKSDFRSLKEGTYKLHEKYHSGHQFENISDLKEILIAVENNRTIPDEINSILVPTIKDILATQEKFNNVESMPSENNQRISSLTSLSYSTQPNVQNQQTQIYQNPPQTQIKEPIREFLQSPSQTPIQQQDQQTFQYIERPIELITKPPIETQIEQKTEFNNNFSSIIDVKPVENAIQEPLQNTFQFQDTQVQTPIEIKMQPEAQSQMPSQTPSEPRLSAFDVFSAPRHPSQPLQQNIPLEPYKEQYREPFQEFKNPTTIQSVQSNEPIQPIEQKSTPIEPISFKSEAPIEEEKTDNSIAIFFGQPSTPEKISNINKLNNIISKTNEMSVPLNELAQLINEIKTQANVSMAEILLILEKLKITKDTVNFITNSQSSNLIELLINNDISYSIFDPKEDKRINLLPLLGLTNLYKCHQCQNEFLDTNEEISPYLLQCPKCRGVMYPNLNEPQGKIDMDYYNSSLIALANSNTWVLIHPSINEKLTFNLIRTALKVSNNVRKIYILDKDINIRESYKKLLLAINSEVDINANMSALEEFLRSLS